MTATIAGTTVGFSTDDNFSSIGYVDSDFSYDDSCFGFQELDFTLMTSTKEITT